MLSYKHAAGTPPDNRRPAGYCMDKKIYQKRHRIPQIGNFLEK